MVLLPFFILLFVLEFIHCKRNKEEKKNKPENFGGTKFRIFFCPNINPSEILNCPKLFPAEISRK